MFDMATHGLRHVRLPKPPMPQKPALHNNSNTSVACVGLSVPKIKPLPSVFALGKCPAKPKRPPHVNCDVFRRNAKKYIEVSNNTKLFPRPPPPANSTFPPARPPMYPVVLEDHYNDVKFINTTQSSLGFGKCSNSFQELEENTYEDIDSGCKGPSEKTKPKDIKKKREKGEKRLEQETKEMKMKEKRKQEARKIIKIKGPSVEAKEDCKTRKNKLVLKQSDAVKIMCKTENPKNYLPARNTEGQYGFVKPDTVDKCSMIHTPNVLYVSNSVEADDQVNNIPKLRSTSKMDEVNSKKRFKKEEKEFEKKFKYKGVIKELHQTTVLPSVTVKKFGNKDLMVKPREMIVHPAGHKPIGRKSEREVGYVSTATANTEEDSSVNEDVGQECIYDND